MTLESHINSLNFSTQLGAIKSLLDSAHAKTTFWGNRIVEVNGFTGSVCLNDIARKVLSTSHQRCNADDLTPAERISGVDIAKKLQKFYHDTGVEIQNANLITKLFNFILEFSNTLSKDFREGIANKNFRTYSTNKFLQQFSTNDYVHHHAVEGGDSFPHPQKLYIKEDPIRQLLLA